MKVLEATHILGMIKQACEANHLDTEVEALDAAISALESDHTAGISKKVDLIDRQAAIDALWKALFEYEDKTEKQFQESKELDVGDWTLHRIFVQNMSDIDRQTILDLPSAQPEQRWIPVTERLPEKPKNYPNCKISRTYFLVSLESGCVTTLGYEFDRDEWQIVGSPVVAWMPLPEPYREGEE